MILRVDGFVRTGRAVDARDLPAEAAEVVAAVRGEGGPATVEAPDPGPVHERVGHVRPSMSVSVRAALAAAARSRGLSAPQDGRLAALRDRLADFEVPDPDRREPARTAAAADTDRLRERVAALRGRIAERREQGRAAEDLAEEFRAAVRSLSEAETERVAADERGGRRAELREARDARERRMRLADEVANLERAARAHLADEMATAYRTAVADAPGPTPDDPLVADGITPALAVIRLADLSAPVVLDCGRFETPSAAATWLDAAVVLV